VLVSFFPYAQEVFDEMPKSMMLLKLTQNKNDMRCPSDTYALSSFFPPRLRLATLSFHLSLIQMHVLIYSDHFTIYDVMYWFW
jgi:hypothetical protein